MNRWALITLALLAAPGHSAETTAAAKFKTSCRVDAITDVKTCMAHAGPLFIIASSAGNWGVLVGTSHAHNSKVTIRFDKTEPIETNPPGWIGTNANSLIDRMHQHQKLTARYHRIDGKVMTETVDLNGIGALINWLTAQTRL